MLDGYRVLDCSSRLGWLAGRLLADLGAEVLRIEAPGGDHDDPEWQALNANKRLLELDLASPGDREVFETLVAGADFLIEPGTNGPFEPCGLRARNPRLIQVSVTPFGRDGPKHAWHASDLELMAAGGALGLAGEPGGTPVRISAPQAHCWAGSQAAVGALTALAHRTATGEGQLVDVSAQAAIVIALSHAPAFFDLLGRVPTRGGEFITGRSIAGARFRAFWPCADGYVNFALYGGAAGRRSNAQLVAWMRERGAALGALAECDWDSFDPKLATQADLDALETPVAAFFGTVTKSEFLAETNRREMLGYPVSTVADIAADPQLAAREYWQDLRVPGDRSVRFGAGFCRIEGRRLPLRHAPGARVGTHEALAEFAAPREPPRRPVGGRDGQALAGVKVVEFGAYAAGPHVGKMLAAFGATVVHVESRGRPDGFRSEYPPFKDDEPGLDRAGCFAWFNDSKCDLTLELKSPSGREVAERLLGWADIVIENMRPGVMTRLGLGFERARVLNPGVTMLSTCNMGQTGPRAQTPGFGSQLSALAGFCGLTGFTDGPPMLLYGPYIDFIASTLGAAAVLAALDRSRRTRRGAWIDLAQYEAGLTFLSGALLAFHRDGRIAARDGNADARAVPHDAYPCRDAQWIALSCHDDAEFQRFARAIGRERLAADARFATATARRAHLGALGAEIAAWAADTEAGAAALGLQQAGVHAHVVNDIADLFADPQLRHRRVWRRRRHGAMGTITSFFSAFDLEASPGDVTAAAPLLGADNAYVCRTLLGMSAEEFAACSAGGAFD